MSNHEIQTISSEFVSLDNPRLQRITPYDIAHALGMLCRFTGHTKEFYSVAQHSVLVSEVVPKEYAYEALMHDASEAFLGDVSSPLKSMLPRYKDIETYFQAKLCERFLVPYPHHPSVKEADLRILATERRDLMNHNNQEWSLLKDFPPYDFTITPLSHQEARDLFLSRFHDLYYN